MEFVRSEPGDDPIVVEAHFAVVPARVFQAWIDPSIVMQWFGPTPNSLHSATIDLRPGGTWQFLKMSGGEKSSGFEGKYLVIAPSERLVMTWSQFVVHATGERESSPASEVEITFVANGRGTDVRVIHRAMHSDAARRGFCGGWELGFTNLNALFKMVKGSDRAGPPPA